MESKAEKIMNMIPNYNSRVHVSACYEDQCSYEAAHCYGWLAGVRDAVDAILENKEIKRMVYKEVEFQYRVEDAKSHLYDYIEDEDEYKAIINSDFPEIVAERFLETHDCNAAENDQFEIIIESMLRERKV